VLSRNDHGPTNSWEASDKCAIAKGNSVRSLLARPFYWLGWLTVVFLVIFFWSAEHIEGSREADLN
jgi:hypothetical protein